MIETMTVMARGRTYSAAKTDAIMLCKQLVGDGTNVAVSEDAYPDTKCWRVDSFHAEVVNTPDRQVQVEATFSFRHSGDPGPILHKGQTWLGTWDYKVT